jgi:hypothetical protein
VFLDGFDDACCFIPILVSIEAVYLEEMHPWGLHCRAQDVSLGVPGEEGKVPEML